MIGLYTPPRFPAHPVFPSPIGGTGKSGKVGLPEIPVSGQNGKKWERVSPTGAHGSVAVEGDAP
jgi:hypothetical protein